METEFTVEQPQVDVVETPEHTFIHLALDGQWVEPEEFEGNLHEAAMPMWRCKYKEIIADPSEVDVEDVYKNPRKYLDWKQASTQQQLLELQAAYNDLCGALIEVAGLVGEANGES